MHLSPYNGFKDSNTIPIMKCYLVDYEHRGRYPIIKIIQHNKHRIISVECVFTFYYTCILFFYIVFYILGTDTDNNGGATSEYHYTNVFLQMICLILLYCLMGSNAFNMFKPI